MRGSFGEVASYIPELAGRDPEWFGISMVTADGSVYEVGDTRRGVHDPVDLQAADFCPALEAIGEEEVRRHVDVEPSGGGFQLDHPVPGTGLPLNRWSTPGQSPRPR